MNYLLFTDVGEARATLAKLNEWSKTKIGSNWGNLKEHPARFIWALPFDERVKGALGPDCGGGRLVSQDEAYMEGFYFGPLEGRFYKPLHKCQETELLFQEFAGSYKNSPFPIQRSLFLGMLGAWYSVQENLKTILQGEVANSLPGHLALSAWWERQKEDIHRKGEILHYLRHLNNSEKHGEPGMPVGLLPMGRFLRKNGEIRAIGSQYMGDAMGLRMGAEGLFLMSQFEGGYEYWKPTMLPDLGERFEILGAEFTFSLIGIPNAHLGCVMPATDPVSVGKLAVDYNYNLVRAAIQQWSVAEK